MQPGPFVNRSDYNSGRNVFDVEFTIGAAGAVPASFPSGFSRASPDAVKSVTHPGTGLYVLTLNDQWADLLVGFGWCVQAASQATPANFTSAGICSVVVVQNLSNTSTKTITFGALNGAGTLTDPASGDDMYFHVEPQFFQIGSQQ